MKILSFICNIAEEAVKPKNCFNPNPKKVF